MFVAKPKNLTPEQAAMLHKASQGQSLTVEVGKSRDPENFPVFDIYPGRNIPIYVPNILNEEGTGLRMSTPFIHSVRLGKRWGEIRCSHGLADGMEILGYDGSCPICDGLPLTWDLYKKEIDAAARAKGIDVNDEAAKELMKDDRLQSLNKRAAKEAEQWYIFPIVAFMTSDIDLKGKTIYKYIQLESGKTIIEGTVMWYCVRKRTFDALWVPALQTMAVPGADAPEHPGGFFGSMNFRYAPGKDISGDKNARRNAAKDLKVGFYHVGVGSIPEAELKAFQDTREYFDNIALDWTPAKADETVIMANWFDMSELTAAANTLFQSTKDALAMFAVASAPAVTGPVNQSANDALASFGGAATDGAGVGANAGAGAGVGANAGVFPAQ